MLRSGRETISDFSAALDQEGERVRDRWWPDFHYLRLGLYHQQLERYFKVFSRDQIKVYLFEDLQRDPLSVAQDAFWFLGVDPAFVAETRITYSASGLPKNRFLHSALQGARAFRPVAERCLSAKMLHGALMMGSAVHNRNLVKPPLSAAARHWLIERYRDDTLKLEGVIQRDLSSWLR
jgi:hypothetical protein